jgi:hypothetical protein
MRVGAHEGFPYNSVELVLLATITGMKLITQRFSFSGQALYPFKALLCLNSLLHIFIFIL